ncbi:MAG: hypothetical protein I3273_04270, partial [Candidatus Moeniiplasma glomeromycotorum]|nr:hypothetical protein [Candidatus Moeniiplasma glomeromycotorum]
MTSKQELIKWMTETREGLTFESKVQLIKDFWEWKKTPKKTIATQTELTGKEISEKFAELT